MMVTKINKLHNIFIEIDKVIQNCFNSMKIEFKIPILDHMEQYYIANLILT